MTHASLFSGIGGFEWGAKYAGISTIWCCEIAKFQRKVLSKNFPNVKQYEDIRDVVCPKYADIITGGFPCQDISIAGKGKGIKGERSGLWKEMYRIVREIRPRYIIIENSPALTIRGLENVLCDLAKAGYNAEWKCISNSEFGFPHKRERIYIIANSDQIERQKRGVQRCGKIESIFIEIPELCSGHTFAQRIYQMPDSEIVGIDDGVSDWCNRVGAIGNAMNPIIALYLFICIIKFENRYGNKRNYEGGSPDARLPEESEIEKKRL